MKEYLNINQVEICPICQAKQLPNEEQPQAGTHAYTIRYECGAEVIVAFGHEDSCQIELECGVVKEDLIGGFINEKFK